MSAKTQSKKKGGPRTFVINAEIPIHDQLIVGEQLQKYFEENMKVKAQGSVKGKLGENVKLSLVDNRVLITVENDASAKRQLKYLTRRYLRKQNLSNYLRVISPKPDTYQIKYLATTTEDAEEEEGVEVE